MEHALTECSSEKIKNAMHPSVQTVSKEFAKFKLLLFHAQVSMFHVSYIVTFRTTSWTLLGKHSSYVSKERSGEKNRNMIANRIAF